MPPIAVALYLIGRWNWLGPERRHEPQFQSYIRGLARQMDRATQAAVSRGQFDARNLAFGIRRLRLVQSNEKKPVEMSDTFALTATNEKVLSRVSMPQIQRNIQFGVRTVGECGGRGISLDAVS